MFTNPTMNKYANLWPDSLSTEEPLRDLGFSPRFGMEEMVDNVIAAHCERNEKVQLRFRAMDKHNTG